MFRHKVTSLAILVVLSLFVQDVDAHLPNYTIDPIVSVEVVTTGDPCVLEMICSASCTFYTGTHSSNENHLHHANALLQVYVYPPGGYPNMPHPRSVFDIKLRSKELRGQRNWIAPTLRISRTIGPGECLTVGAVSRGVIWTSGQLDHKYSPTAQGRQTYGNLGAAPGVGFNQKRLASEKGMPGASPFSLVFEPAEKYGGVL